MLSEHCCWHATLMGETACSRALTCAVLQVMSRELFDYLVREKIADGPLIAKWRKPGFEILCSMLAIQKGNHNFGTTSHCRVRRLTAQALQLPCANLIPTPI